MRKAYLKLALVLGVLLVLALAGTAFGKAVVDNETVYGNYLRASFVSTGNSSFWIGNGNNVVSGVATSTNWYNQNIVLSPPTFASYVSSTSVGLTDDFDVYTTGTPAASWYALSTNGSTYGANVSLNGTTTLSAEGVYSVGASGTVSGQNVVSASDPDNISGHDVTLTVGPMAVTDRVPAAFGIDKTRAVVKTDAVPVYSTVATVSVIATDALSGVEQYILSMDSSPADYAYWGSDGTTYSVPVAFGPGMHTLSWYVLDNAGNVTNGSTSFIVRPAGFIASVSKVTVKLAKRKATFTGTVDAMPSAQTIKVKLDVKSGKKWKLGKYSFTTTVAAYGKTFSIANKSLKKGTYRATAYDGSAHSAKATTFKVK